MAAVAAVAAVAAAEAIGAGSTECEPGALILMGIRPERTSRINALSAVGLVVVVKLAVWAARLRRLCPFVFSPRLAPWRVPSLPYSVYVQS